MNTLGKVREGVTMFTSPKTRALYVRTEGLVQIATHRKVASWRRD
jgi:hypothetical protein